MSRSHEWFFITVLNYSTTWTATHIRIKHLTKHVCFYHSSQCWFSWYFFLNSHVNLHVSVPVYNLYKSSVLNTKNYVSHRSSSIFVSAINYIFHFLPFDTDQISFVSRLEYLWKNLFVNENYRSPNNYQKQIQMLHCFPAVSL